MCVYIYIWPSGGSRHRARTECLASLTALAGSISFVFLNTVIYWKLSVTRQHSRAICVFTHKESIEYSANYYLSLTNYMKYTSRRHCLPGITDHVLGANYIIRRQHLRDQNWNHRQPSRDQLYYSREKLYTSRKHYRPSITDTHTHTHTHSLTHSITQTLSHSLPTH